MRQRTATARSAPLIAVTVLALALSAACGGEQSAPGSGAGKSADTGDHAGDDQAGDQAGDDHAEDQAGDDHGTAASTDAEPETNAEAEPETNPEENAQVDARIHGEERHQEAQGQEATALAGPLDPALMTVASRTASALSGLDWGLVYDLSCRALVGDQSRQAYVATLSAAGSPAQLAGGTLTVGSPVAAGGAGETELPAADGEVRWVQMRQGEGIIGVARFVDAGDGFRYCGLSV